VKENTAGWNKEGKIKEKIEKPGELIRDCQRSPGENVAIANWHAQLAEIPCGRRHENEV